MMRSGSFPQSSRVSSGKPDSVGVSIPSDGKLYSSTASARFSFLLDDFLKAPSRLNAEYSATAGLAIKRIKIM